MSGAPSLGALRGRAERARLAALLRAGGMPTAEIAGRLGVRPGTVRDYLWDPEGVRRPGRPGSRCPSCGRPVSGAGRRCPGCAGAARVRWPEPAILAAFAEWRRQTGRPASATDWARARGGRWPSPATVIRRFGSFATARRLAEKGDEP
jgi:hypothetical protein